MALVLFFAVSVKSINNLLQSYVEGNDKTTTYP